MIALTQDTSIYALIRNLSDNTFKCGKIDGVCALNNKNGVTCIYFPATPAGSIIPAWIAEIGRGQGISLAIGWSDGVGEASAAITGASEFPEFALPATRTWFVISGRNLGITMDFIAGGDMHEALQIDQVSSAWHAKS